MRPSSELQQCLQITSVGYSGGHVYISTEKAEDGKNVNYASV
jgi:hypothetical protein